MMYKERLSSDFVRIVKNEEDTWVDKFLRPVGKDYYERLKKEGFLYVGYDKNLGDLKYKSKEDILKNYKKVHLFTKKDRSTFSYWFSHWCAFQLTALNMRVWKFKYLFHDFEKPWLKLIWDYKKVQKFHRTHSKHHLAYGEINGWDKVDWEAMVIDWECSALSKQEAQLDARDTLENELISDRWKQYEDIIRKNVEPILNKLEL